MVLPLNNVWCVTGFKLVYKCSSSALEANGGGNVHGGDEGS